MAKAAFWSVTDAEARKRGEQTGLDTPWLVYITDDRISRISGSKVLNCSIKVFDFGQLLSGMDKARAKVTQQRLV